MSQSTGKNISVPNFFGQNKILLSESPGRTAVLIHKGKSSPKKFKDAHAALDWCEKNSASFYYLPVEQCATASN
jgi:hypothetical protein